MCIYLIRFIIAKKYLITHVIIELRYCIIDSCRSNIKRHRPRAVMLGTDLPVAQINNTPEDYDIIMNCKFKLELEKQLRH